MQSSANYGRLIVLMTVMALPVSVTAQPSPDLTLIPSFSPASVAFMPGVQSVLRVKLDSPITATDLSVTATTNASDFFQSVLSSPCSATVSTAGQLDITLGVLRGLECFVEVAVSPLSADSVRADFGPVGVFDVCTNATRTFAADPDPVTLTVLAPTADPNIQTSFKAAPSSGVGQFVTFVTQVNTS